MIEMKEKRINIDDNKQLEKELDEAKIELDKLVNK
jgi:hypothetical protein